MGGGAGVAPGLARSLRARGMDSVLGHENDGARRPWLHGLAARATCAARGWVAPPTSILPLWGGGQTAARKGHGFPCRGTGMTARGAPMAPWTRRPRHLRSPRVGRSPHLNPPPLGRRPNGGEEGVWIPVSGYGNDGARRAYGSMASPISVGGKGGCRGEGLAAGGRSVRKWHGFPCRGTGMTERGGEEASGGGKGHGFPCRGTGMMERVGEEAKQ